MAQRRMISKSVVENDRFYDLPLSAQALYIHLVANADDDGFIESPKRITVFATGDIDDLKILVEKGYLIHFESGVCVLTHWKMQNQIRKDRYTPTVYTEEFNQLDIIDNKYIKRQLPGIPDNSPVLTRCQPDVIPDGNQMSDTLHAQYSIGKYSIDKYSNAGAEPIDQTNQKQQQQHSNNFQIVLKDGSLYNVEDNHITTLKDTYPNVDVIGELKKMAAWCESNPEKRKTGKGVKRFINNWIASESRAKETRCNAKPATKNRFNNFEQRDNDYTHLERQLVGSSNN